MKTVYTTEELRASQFHYQGKTMSYDEVSKALGQHPEQSNDDARTRIINKMLNKPNSKMKLVGAGKKSYDQKVIEAVYEEVVVEDTIEALADMAIQTSEESRAQKAETKGDVVHAVKTLTVTDIDLSNQLEHYLAGKLIRFTRVPGDNGQSIFVMQNITDTDINKINGYLSRKEFGVKADAALKKSFEATSIATKGVVEVTGKVTAGVVNVATATTVQVGKSLVDIGSNAYVNARRESMKQKERLSVDPDFLEASMAVKRGMNSLKAKLGFGSSKERMGWS